MPYWPKLLGMSIAIMASAEIYLPLFFNHDRGLGILVVSLLMSSLWTLRLVSSTVIIWLVDSGGPVRVVRVLLGLTLVGIVSLSGVLWLERCVTLCLATVLFGVAFEPILALRDIAIIKLLGDYKTWLFETESRYGLAVSAITLASIGWAGTLWDLDRVLLWVCLSGGLATVVVVGSQWTHGFSVMTRLEEDRALFLKNALLPNDPLMMYKPYSLFGEPLSHISEEDASMLQRMASSATHLSLRRHSTNQSSSTTSTNGSGIGTTSNMPAITMYGTTTTNYANDNINMVRSAQESQVSATDLALLPLPPAHTTMSVLMVQGPIDLQFPTQTVEWQIQSISVSLLLLGVVFGMINGLLLIYLYTVLALPMWAVGLAASIHTIAELVLQATAVWWIPQLTLSVSTGAAHATLIICVFAYTLLRPEIPGLWAVVTSLQAGQGIAFHLLWLSITQRVHALLWTEEDQRIIQIGKMSALYGSIGPAIGVTVAGLVLNHETLLEGFTMIFRCTIALTAASFVVSWGWSSTD